MRVRPFDNPADFQRHVSPMLLGSEAENCLTIGIISRAVAGGAAEWPLMLSIDDGGGCIAAATMNPGYGLVLTRAPRDGVDALVAYLADAGVSLPAVQAPVGTAEAFAAAWRGRTGAAASPGMGLGVYALDAVIPPDPPAAGAMRLAVPADLDQLDGWVVAFCIDAKIEHPDPAKRRRQTQARIDEGSLYVWCDPTDGRPVTMAAAVGTTPNGIRISLVYTPSELRRRGYASSLVAAMSQRLLDEGRRFCFLYTDLANPTSNKIYQAVGYRHVCDIRKIEFAPG